MFLTIVHHNTQIFKAFDPITHMHSVRLSNQFCLSVCRKQIFITGNLHAGCIRLSQVAHPGPDNWLMRSYSSSHNITVTREEKLLAGQWLHTKINRTALSILLAMLLCCIILLAALLCCIILRHSSSFSFSYYSISASTHTSLGSTSLMVLTLAWHLPVLL